MKCPCCGHEFIVQQSDVILKRDIRAKEDREKREKHRAQTKAKLLKILDLYENKHLTQKEIGVLYGVTCGRISNLYRRALSLRKEKRI